MGRMLKAVTKGKQDAPLRELLYGTEGIGKTTFGAEAPDPIFLGEDGTKRMNVARFPTAGAWADVKAAIAELTIEKHDHKTLVCDTLDHFEGLIITAISEAERRAFADIPFGKGPDYALDYWRDLLRDLERLQARRGMNVILLAHAQIKTFKNPMGDDWDRFSLKIHEKAGALIKGWAESVLFASYDLSVKKAHKADKLGARRGEDEPRYLYTQRIPAADAKNRYDLPARIGLSYSEFAKLVERGDVDRAKQVRENALELLDQVADPEKRARAKEMLEKAGLDLKSLRNVVGRLTATLREQDEVLEQAAAGSEGVSPAGVGGSTEGSVSPAAASSKSTASGGPEASPAKAPAPSTPSPVPAATGHVGTQVPNQGAPERTPAPAIAATPNGGGVREGSPGEAARATQPAPSAPPPAAAAWVAPTGPVTVAEVLAWIGDTQVAHAEAAVKILSDPKAFPSSDTPGAIASLMVVNGVRRAEVDAWWKGAAGEKAYTRKGAFAPISGMEFVQLWYEVRAHQPPPAETDEQVAKQLGLAPSGRV